ncbi:unnamed protein product [Thelazia callipaeda]|uniref:STAS domain-containing protein n=1 Tax=Thelazia callipaeda TaxID=103827 RepID=A0A158RCQ9_THECL|nr:unnamed protein product [Thelazia callipaeda]
MADERRQNIHEVSAAMAKTAVERKRKVEEQDVQQIEPKTTQVDSHHVASHTETITQLKIKAGTEELKEDETPPQSVKSTQLSSALLKENAGNWQNAINSQITLHTEHKPAINQEQFDKKHGYRRNRFPIIGWLPSYDWHEDLLRDILNGIMISIIYIPQGLAYGLMVGLPPIYGIYSGIVGPLVYILFGTSHQASTGAFAIISMMVGSVIEQSSLPFTSMQNGTENLCCLEMPHKPDLEKAIRLSSLITFFVGVIQVILGLLNAGLLAVWLSDQLVEGLTSGAAVHVLASQLGTMTGIKNVPTTSDTFGIVRFSICFLRNIHTVEYHTFACTIICVFCLLVSKLIIDPIIKPWMKIKFPMEIFVVVFSIVLSYFATNTPIQFRLDIVGDIDVGMPSPSLPDFSESGNIVFSAFSIAIVSFVIHIALAKLIAKEFKYQINANQEWLALGAMHIVASFFGCFAGGSSLSRTVTSARLGTKSQLTTLVVVIILLIVAFGAAPLFKYLPKTVLSCIVVVAMKELYMKICWSRILFQESIIDFFIFLITFSAVVLINVNIGLAIGVVFALLTVVLRSQWAESTCMGRIPGTADFKGIGHYRTAMEIPGIKVFRFDAPLYFANAELFLSSIHRYLLTSSATGLNPLLIVAKLKQTVDQKKKTITEMRKGNKEKSDEEIQLTVRRHCFHPSHQNLENKEENEDLVQLTHIIIDCSSFPYIDLMGLDALARAHAEYRAINITVFFACCKVAVRQMFENSHFYEHVPKSYMFVSLQDAVAQAQYEQEQDIRFNRSLEQISSKIMVTLLNYTN